VVLNPWKSQKLQLIEGNGVSEQMHAGSLALVDLEVAVVILRMSVGTM
jgi:hypothetical protein